MKSLVRAWALAGLACASGLLAALPAAAAAAASAAAASTVDYADAANWLCRPGRADVCAEPLTSTVVSPADGSLTRKTYAPDPAAPIDCFYVYPTVSHQLTANADTTLDPEERRVGASQFARFSGVCRPYAPLYRQTTDAALVGAAKGADPELAYGDVRAAWRFYLEHDNQGRGVVLIGHSQGAHHLTRLIAEEIDGKPAQRRLVSAILLGGNVQVAPGADAGGDFRHVRLCRSAGQAGCLIAYSTYLAADPPGPESNFGRPKGPGLAAACVNPAALLGHDGLDAELPTRAEVARLLGTPLVENPGLISARCATIGDRAFLAITVKDSGVGAVTLGKALSDAQARAPAWGLHALDVNLALGDLVEVVARQTKAWAAQR